MFLKCTENFLYICDMTTNRFIQINIVIVSKDEPWRVESCSTTITIAHISLQ